MEYAVFLEVYHQIFDEAGNVRRCGRSICKRLIGLCKELWPDGKWGSEETGIMNVSAIQRQYQLVMRGEA